MSVHRPSLDLETTINGRAVRLSVEPRELLLDVLRDRLGMLGTVRSCDVQICGACTVLVDGLPVSACTYLAFEASGKDVLTVEGLAEGGRLHPIQQAFIDHGALQCGFCTPGMIVAAKALLDDHPAPTEQQVREYLRGNICRCTGYGSIVRAILDAADRLRDEAAPAAQQTP